MIIVRIWEGLGNQMFQYAYARALSIRMKQPVFLDARGTGKAFGDMGLAREYRLANFRISLPQCLNADYFYPFLSKDGRCMNVLKKMSENGLLPYRYYKEKTVAYNGELARLKGNWYLQAYFQDEKYFKEYEGLIRKEFRPKKKIRISSELRNILESKNTVSIHIRRGDYKRFNAELPARYYRQAIDYIEENIENPFWVVFSDEPQWVRENINFKNSFYYVSGNEVLEDYEEMLVMSRCRNHVISNSTFGWWGAWLDEKKDKLVVGPRNWFLGTMSGYRTNIMPEEWKRI